ncbi:MAG: hypothetical protein HKN79_02210 [Flavobacteriales bacterium]|nr:hypothetical protein [Flavobacteriales bacterium]
MKIRLKDNTIRIRLSMDELACLAEGETVTMATALGTHSLLTELVPCEDSHDIGLQDGLLFIKIEQSKYQNLHASEEEGFEIELGDSIILIQKDYQCVGREEALNVGLFPNPKGEDAAC